MQFFYLKTFLSFTKHSRTVISSHYQQATVNYHHWTHFSTKYQRAYLSSYVRTCARDQLPVFMASEGSLRPPWWPRRLSDVLSTEAWRLLNGRCLIMERNLRRTRVRHFTRTAHTVSLRLRTWGDHDSFVFVLILCCEEYKHGFMSRNEACSNLSYCVVNWIAKKMLFLVFLLKFCMNNAFA